MGSSTMLTDHRIPPSALPRPLYATMQTYLTIILMATILSIQSCSPRHIYKKTYLDCLSKDIEKNDSCLLGLELREALKMLEYDTTKSFVVDEPPGILRGLSISQADTCEIRIYVPRTSIFDTAGISYDIDRKNISEIIDKKVIGVTWRKYKDKVLIKRNSIGSVILVWGN